MPVRRRGLLMRPIVKTAVVLAGYGAALAGGVAATYLYDRMLPRDVSDGMAAFASVQFGLLALGFLALVPTGLALWWLRPVKPFWRAMKALCLAGAATGPAALALFLITRQMEPGRNPLFFASYFSLERIFATPVFCAGFLLIALFTPAAFGRKLLFAAAALEAAVGAIAFLTLLSGTGLWHPY